MTAEPKIVPWGSENPRRGLIHHDLAVAFYEDFPIGRQLTLDVFGHWLEQHNLLAVPSREPRSARRYYVDKRHEWRERINSAGAHSRMAAAVGLTFTTALIAKNTLEVRDCLTALATTDNVRPIEMHAKARRRQMAHWAAGIDWSRQAPHTYQSACLLFKFTQTLRKHAEITHKDYRDATAEFTDYLQKLKFLPPPPESA